MNESYGLWERRSFAAQLLLNLQLHVSHWPHLYTSKHTIHLHD